MKASSQIVVFAVVLVVVLGYEAEVSMAVACNPTELDPCLGSITSGAAPSTLCCTKVKQQQPCLCQYIKDPTFQKYVTSPNARKVVSSCGVSIPKC